MIGSSLCFSCLKKKGLAYGDFEGRIHPEASCSSTQRFISTISSRVKEYSLEERCPGSFLNSILISKSSWEQGSSSHFASLKTEGGGWANQGWGQCWENRCLEYWQWPGYSFLGVQVSGLVVMGNTQGGSR